MDYKQYLEFTHDRDYIELYDYYSTETIFDIMGVARQENPHSSLIRWILGSHSGHGLGDMPFRKFMETVSLMREKGYGDAEVQEYVAEKLWKNSNNLLASENEDLFEEVKYGRYVVKDIRVANEVVLDNQRRADIVAVVTFRLQQEIRGKRDYALLLMIENKIGSKEHTNQTTEYVNSLNDEKIFAAAVDHITDGQLNEISFDECLQLFVYMNPSRNQDVKQELIKRSTKKRSSVGALAASDEYITITYQYFLNGVLEPLAAITQNETTKARLNEYIRCLGQAKIEQIDQNEKAKKNTSGNEYLIMAVSGEEKKKAKRLWAKYQPVILDVLQSVDTDAFVLNDSDVTFWISLTNLYRISMDEMRKDVAEDAGQTARLEELEALVRDVNKRNVLTIRKYEYKGNEYASRASRNIGLLCRDLINDFVDCQQKAGKDVRMELEWLREKIRDEAKLNWLREGILFEDEAAQLPSIQAYWDKGYDNSSYKSRVNGKMRYSCTCFEDFADHFFCYWTKLKTRDGRLEDRNRHYDRDRCESDLSGYEYPMEILLQDGSKVYVAKYWSDRELRMLIGWLDERANMGLKQGLIFK